MAAANQTNFQPQWSVVVVGSGCGPVGSNVALEAPVRKTIETLERGHLTRLIEQNGVDGITNLAANGPPIEVGRFGDSKASSRGLTKVFKAFNVGLYAEIDSTKPELIIFTLRQDGTSSGLVWFNWRVEFRWTEDYSIGEAASKHGYHVNSWAKNSKVLFGIGNTIATDGPNGIRTWPTIQSTRLIMPDRMGV